MTTVQCFVICMPPVTLQKATATCWPYQLPRKSWTGFVFEARGCSPKSLSFNSVLVLTNIIWWLIHSIKFTRHHSINYVSGYKNYLEINVLLNEDCWCNIYITIYSVIWQIYLEVIHGKLLFDEYVLEISPAVCIITI